ncbi:MAG: hemerythrin domain-containing protein [Planctomycetales bacterium]|nr:hemerythrin domain-containing protein [Planctomycetales bacterium]
MRDLEEGRVYLQHLSLAHCDLEKKVRAAKDLLLQLIAEASPNGRRETIAERLADLLDELSDHFRKEESGGCLEMALTRVPRLADQVKKLEQQRPDLIEELDEIAHSATRSDIGSTTTRFARFSERLLAHEKAEARVMAEAFGTELEDAWNCD